MVLIKSKYKVVSKLNKNIFNDNNKLLSFKKKKWVKWARHSVCQKVLSCLSKMLSRNVNEGQSNLESLIKIFSKMPGLGPRSAQRLVFHLIKKREVILDQLISSLENINNKILKSFR